MTINPKVFLPAEFVCEDISQVEQVVGVMPVDVEPNVHPDACIEKAVDIAEDAEIRTAFRTDESLAAVVYFFCSVQGNLDLLEVPGAGSFGNGLVVEKVSVADQG